MRDAVARHGWDGAWFRRAYDFFGRPVGSAENDEGQIFVEPQGMCVMAGIGLDDGRARLALDSVRERLATPHGIVVLQPAFTRYHLHLGEISTYPGGYKENAGVFCHTNPWVMIAETMVGDGDGAIDYYLRINPSAREDDLGGPPRRALRLRPDDRRAATPPTPGEAKNTWLTGTAAWNFVAISQWILGIRPEHGGLRIDPCVPAGVGRLHGHAALPRRHLPDRRPQGAGHDGPRDPAGRRRARRGRQPRARCRPRPGRRSRSRRSSRRRRDRSGDSSATVGVAAAYGRREPGA